MEKPVIVEETVVYQANRPAALAPTGVAVGQSGGYEIPGSNCVACVYALTGRKQNGNAGTWQASASVPSIGAIAIFRAGQQGAGGLGHVGVVVGIHGNKISLAHCNWGGGQTEFTDTGAYW